VRSRLALPSDRHVMVADRTLMWPVARLPSTPPKSRTSRSRASVPLTVGQGWPARQLPSISRAATPAIRIFGPSAHQMGPSPSQTAIGVQANERPAGTTILYVLPLASDDPTGDAMMAIASSNDTFTRNRRRHCRGPGAAHNLGHPASPALLRLRGPRRNCETHRRPMTLECSALLRSVASPHSRDGNDNRRSCGCCDSLRR